MKKTCIIPCSWQLYDWMLVEAETLEEAIHKAIQKEPLPDGEYITDSFQIDKELIATAGIEAVLPNGRRIRTNPWRKRKKRSNADQL